MDIMKLHIVCVCFRPPNPNRNSMTNATRSDELPQSEYIYAKPNRYFDEDIVRNTE